MVAAGAASLKTAARAQPVERPRRIGVQLARRADDPEGQAYVAALRQALEQQGWIEGRTIQSDYRWLAGSPEEARAGMAELIARDPDVLVVNATPYLHLAQQLAGSIPVVFVIIADPLGQGFVASLARPGGTITGFGAEEASMGEKWLELLREIAPGTAACTCPFNPQTAANPGVFIERMAAAGARMSIEVVGAPVQGDADIELAIAAAGRAGRTGLVALPDVFLYARRDAIVAAAARHAVPAVYYDKPFARAGGLLALGIDRVDQFRRAAGYVTLILNGASPADLPVQMPARFTLTVNLVAARALGLRVPESLLARADEVME
jgi:putative ABC transport system substrate-binding protein